MGQRWLVNGFLDRAPIRDIAIYSDPTNRLGRTIERPQRAARPDAGARRAQRDRPERAGGRPAPRRHWRSRHRADLEHEGSGSARRRQRLPGIPRSGAPPGSGRRRAHPRRPRRRRAPRIPLRVRRTRLPGRSPDARRLAARALRPGPRRTDRISPHLARPCAAARPRGVANGAGTTAGAAYLDGVKQGANGSAAGLLVFAAVAAARGRPRRRPVGPASHRRARLARAPARRARPHPQFHRRRAHHPGRGRRGRREPRRGRRRGGVARAGSPSASPGGPSPIPGSASTCRFSPCAAWSRSVLLATFAFLWARARIARVRPPVPPPRRVSVAVRAALGVGAPPAVATGVQLAADRTSESGPVPLRTALRRGGPRGRGDRRGRRGRGEPRPTGHQPGPVGTQLVLGARYLQWPIGRRPRTPPRPRRSDRSRGAVWQRRVPCPGQATSPRTRSPRSAVT